MSGLAAKSTSQNVIGQLSATKRRIMMETPVRQDKVVELTMDIDNILRQPHRPPLNLWWNDTLLRSFILQTDNQRPRLNSRSIYA